MEIYDVEKNTNESLSKTINELLIYQMQHERSNAQTYLNFSGICDSQGLTGSVKYFKKQSDDEIKHFQMIFDYCCDRVGFIPELLDIPSVTFNQQAFLVDMIKSSFDLELLTTKKLCDIKRTAIEDNDFLTDTFLDEMIKEQREEEKSSYTLYQRALMFAAEPCGMMLLDTEMGTL